MQTFDSDGISEIDSGFNVGTKMTELSEIESF